MKNSTKLKKEIKKTYNKLPIIIQIIVLLIIVLTIALFPNKDFNNEKLEVDFYACVDGDTAKFITNKGKETVRFIAIDTPETVHPTKKEEPFGKEASDYTCNSLKKAKKIILELDDNSNKYDKYNRLLAWVFIDDTLLQKELIKLGYAKISYLYGDYKYTDYLKIEEKKAKNKKLGIWSEN